MYVLTEPLNSQQTTREVPSWPFNEPFHSSSNPTYAGSSTGFDFDEWNTYTETTPGWDAQYSAGAAVEEGRLAPEKEITQGFSQGFYQDYDEYPVAGGSDPAVGVEAAALTAVFTGTEASTATNELSSIAAAIGTSNDTNGVVTEAAVGIAIVAPAETGVGLDEEDLFRVESYVSSDVSLGVFENLVSHEVELDVSEVPEAKDSATFREVTVGVTKPETQEYGLAGEEVETLSVRTTANPDLAAGTEGTPRIALSNSDAGAGAEVATPATSFTSAETGVGSEPQALNVTETFYDSNVSATFAESKSIITTLYETGDGVDVASNAVAHSTAETGSADDSYIVLGKHDSETAIGVDTAAVAAKLTSAETMEADELGVISIPGEQSLDTSPYYTQILASNPTNYWRFGELGGNVVFDKQDRTRGVLTGSVEYVRGLVAGENTALLFGVGLTANFGDMYFDYSLFSLEFVCRDVDGLIIEKANELTIEATAGTLTFKVLGTGGSVVHELSHPENRGHFAMSISNGVARLYYNGELVDSDEQTGEFIDTVGAFNIPAIGTGVIDELSIYDRALTEEECFRHYYAAILNQEYALGVQSTRPIWHATLDGRIEEYNELYNSYEVAPVDWVNGPKKFFVAGDLAVLSDGGSIKYDTQGHFEDLETYTVAVAVRVPVGATLPAYPLGNASGWSVQIDASGKFLFYNGQQAATAATGPALNDGLWHQLMAVFDGTDIIFYVDGSEVERQAFVPYLYGEDETVISRAADPLVEISEGFVTERPLTPEAVQGLYKIMQHGRNDIVVPFGGSYEAKDEGFTVYQYEPELASV